MDDALLSASPLCFYPLKECGACSAWRKEHGRKEEEWHIFDGDVDDGEMEPVSAESNAVSADCVSK